MNEELKMNSIDGTVSGTTNNNINNNDTSGNFKVINDTTTTNNDTFTTITDIGLVVVLLVKIFLDQIMGLEIIVVLILVMMI